MESSFRMEMSRRGKYYIIDAVKTRGKQKEARIMKLAPIAENGMLFLRHGMGDLERELFQFPYGATIDMVDALAWQVDSTFRPTHPQYKRPTTRVRYNTFTLEQIRRSCDIKRGNDHSYIRSEVACA